MVSFVSIIFLIFLMLVIYYFFLYNKSIKLEITLSEQEIFIKSIINNNYNTFYQYLINPNFNVSNSDSDSLVVACHYQRLNMIKDLLKLDNINPNAQQGSPLVNTCHNANYKEGCKVIELLLSHKDIDVNINNYEPLKILGHLGYIKAAKILLNDKRTVFDYEDNNLFTTVCTHENIDLTEFLLNVKNVNPTFNRNYNIILNSLVENQDMLNVLSDNKAYSFIDKEKLLSSSLKNKSLEFLFQYSELKDDVFYQIKKIGNKNALDRLEKIIVKNKIKGF